MSPDHIATVVSAVVIDDDHFCRNVLQGLEHRRQTTLQEIAHVVTHYDH